MAFKNISDHIEQVYSKTNDFFCDSIVMLENIFGRVMRRIEKWSSRNVSPDVRDNQPQ